MTRLLRPFELDPFDLLWKDLLETHNNFSALTQKITHPVDIYETKDGIRFEIAAVGLSEADIDITVEAEQLRIKYTREKAPLAESIIYKGIKRSGFDLTWKISTKFDLTRLEASLEKGLLILSIPVAEGKAIRQIQIKPTKAIA